MTSIDRDKDRKLVASGVLSDTGDVAPFKVDPSDNSLLMVSGGAAPTVVGEPVSQRDDNRVPVALLYDETGDRPLSARVTDAGELIITPQ